MGPRIGRAGLGARQAVPLQVVVYLALVACSGGPGSPPSSPDQPRPAAGARAHKRITAAIQSDPGTLNFAVNPPGAGVPGLNVLQTLVGSGMSIPDDRGVLRPILAQAVPNVENGLWKVFPDGRMETRWQLRTGASWHDGTAVIADDIRFTASVLQDRELDILVDPAWESVDRIETPDPRTVVVGWRRPYIKADSLFNNPPFPRHLLERTYADGKSSFTQLPYWTQEFVGTGPYRLRQFVAGSQVVLEANDRFVLGRPRVDEVEVRFIPDAGALAANVLAGGVDITLGRSLSLEQAMQVRDQWRDGRMEITYASWIVVFPQFINPSPAVIGDVRFRRALLHAIDRQQMADTLMAGQVPVAHTFLRPDDPQYAVIEPQIARYEYDPRRAAQMVAGVGYVKASDGFRDSGGRRLQVEIRASAGRDLNQKAILAIADYWQQLGIAAEPLVMPQQRARDREYVQTFPGFILYNQPNELASLNRIRSSQTPLPENNYVGNNNSRYTSPELDGLIERLFATIPERERTQVLGQIIRHTTETLNMLGMFYNGEPSMVSHRLLNVTPKRGEGAIETWNAHEWDVAGS